MGTWEGALSGLSVS